MEENCIFDITEQEAGERLDKILAARFKQRLSRSYLQSLIERGAVQLNGAPSKKRFCPQLNDSVEVQFEMPKEIDLIPEAIPLDVLFEDEAILVINKPAGLVVHPAPGHWTGTLVNAMLHHCRGLERAFSTSFRPGLVHRLDKETTGVLIAAKTARAHERLVKAFSERQVEKEYLALTIGNPGRREVQRPIGRHPVHRKKMAVLNEGGRPAHSVIETLETQEMISLVRVWPRTGRTHQIRVHLQHLNAQILGDGLYGSQAVNRRFSASRQMLHARSLHLKHPITAEKLSFVAPLPEDMLKLMKQLNITWRSHEGCSSTCEASRS